MNPIFIRTLIALCVMFAALGLSQAQMAFPDLGKAQAAVARVFPILDRKPPIDAADPGGLRPAEVKGAIALEAVAFHYPSRPAAPGLRGLTLAVPAGQTVALGGESGVTTVKKDAW
jgi:ATP-binding cassette subfamily B (MDR/TAP) protein 1